MTDHIRTLELLQSAESPEHVMDILDVYLGRRQTPQSMAIIIMAGNILTEMANE